MNIFQAAILGIVEGLTEFLPISSTFHLIQVSRILGIAETDFVKLFEVVIQGGAILAVILLYYNDIKENPLFLKKVLISFLPTAVIGFLLYKIIKNVFFEAEILMVAVFILVGIIYLITELLIKRKKLNPEKTIDKLSYKDAFMIGLIQSLSVIPGVSRAGAVILGGLFLGYRRDESAYYSFLLSIPTLLAAAGFDLLKSRNTLLSSGSNSILLLIGFIMATIVAYIVVKWFITYLKKNSLNIFGIYRIIFGLILGLIFH